MKPTDLNDLKYSKYAVKPINQRKYGTGTQAFDTETKPDGYGLVIGCSDKTFQETKNIYDILTFMIQKRFRSTYNFFFNLEFDTNVLIKYFPIENIKELSIYNKTTFEDYTISMIPRKLLSITKGVENKKKTYRYYDIAQFYQLGSLEETYYKTFKEKYSKSQDASIGFYELNEDIIKYCIEDAIATKKLCDNFVNATHKIMPLKRFYSPASLGKCLLRLNLNKDYEFKPFKYEKNLYNLHQFALNSYRGGRIEIIKRGYFEKLFIYDICSAYPYIQNNLNGIGNYSWKNKEYEPESLHSFFKISLNIDDVIVSPIKYMTDKNLVIYPKGTLVDIFVSKIELETLMKHSFDFVIKEAVHNSGSISKPFSYMQEIYDLRRKYKKAGNPLQLPMKLALNASYGILIERQKRYFEEEINLENSTNPEIECYKTEDGKVMVKNFNYKAGQFFNPVWAAEITSAIRCKIYEDSIKHEKHIVKYSTDSITFDKKVKLDFGEKLGQYEDSPEYRGLVVGNGVYSFENKKTQERTKKFRSFNKKIDIMEIAEKNLNSTKYEYIKKSPLKLKESKKDNYKNMNIFVKKKKILNLNFDNKRKWLTNVKTFKDLRDNIIESIPLTI